MSVTPIRTKPRARQRVYVSVEIDLGELDTADLREELARRHDDDSPDDWEFDPDRLRSIRTLILCGQRDAALSSMQDFIRDALGTAL